MKICPHCQTQYANTKKFCQHDGHRLETLQAGQKVAPVKEGSCARCGKSRTKGHQFCPYCGGGFAADLQPGGVEATESLSAIEVEMALLEAEMAPVTGEQGQTFAAQTTSELTWSEQPAGSHTGPRSLSRAVGEVFARDSVDRRRGRRHAYRKTTRKVGLGAITLLLTIAGAVAAPKAIEWIQDRSLAGQVAVTEKRKPPVVPQTVPAPPSPAQKPPAAPIAQAQPAAVVKKEPPPVPQAPPAAPQESAMIPPAPKQGLPGSPRINTAIREIRVSGAGADDSTRSPEALQAAMETHLPDLQDVYEQARRSRPDLQGKLGCKLTVEPDGTVSKVGVYSDKITNWKFRKAVRHLAGQWRFPSASRPAQIRCLLLFTSGVAETAAIGG